MLNAKIANASEDFARMFHLLKVISYPGHFVAKSFRTILAISYPFLFSFRFILYPLWSFRTHFGHFFPSFIFLFKYISVISYPVFTFSYPSHFVNGISFSYAHYENKSV